MVLVGADGAGKTLLARSAAERFAAAKPSTVMRRVVGTATGRIVPFGAFRALLDINETGRPAELLRAAHESLTADGGELLFVVDDAHHLDHLSATLVYQLALSRSARLVVTVRADTELPDAVAALSADELLTVVEVEPLDGPATAALLESALGAPPDAAVTTSATAPGASLSTVSADRRSWSPMWPDGRAASCSTSDVRSARAVAGASAARTRSV